MSASTISNEGYGGHENMRACLFGAAPDSGNLGVEALYQSVVSAFDRELPDSELCVFDNGWGIRPIRNEHHNIALEHCGVRLSRRIHRPEAWAHIRAAARLHISNPVVNRVKNADLVLDVSGGDSFSDIYGTQRLKAILAPKHLALSLGRPLVLLPQTYGPFNQASARNAARKIVQHSTLAYARDADSHAALLDLAGDIADPNKLRLGVDMAFALEPLDPGALLPDETRKKLLRDADHPVVGLNVSGLLYGDTTTSERLGLRIDYKHVVIELAKKLLNDGCELYLIPHVAPSHANNDNFDNDVSAINDLISHLPEHHDGRVHAIPPMPHAAHTKWVISQLDWFCGTRMHATIAGLSSGVPTAAIAYSFKTRGVFATVEQEQQVIDARQLSSADTLDRLWELWEGRKLARDSVSESTEAVVKAARRQLADVLRVA